MDASTINPFLESFTNIMPQLGFSGVKKEGLKLNGMEVRSLGVIVMINIVGDIEGKIIYTMNEEDAKKVASTMMMGMPINDLDELAQSAISEMINMLTANAATIFSKDNINVDISTPNLIKGDYVAEASTEKVISVNLKIDDIMLETNISLQKNM